MVGGNWSLLSDHIPLTAHVATDNQNNLKINGEDKDRLRNHSWYLNKARKWYYTTLKTFKQKFGKCHTTFHMKQTYRGFKHTLLQLWNDACRPVSGRYKQFWTHALDKLAKKRQKYYKNYKKNCRQSDWQDYQRLDRIIKRMVNRSRKNTFKKIGKHYSERESTRRDKTFSASSENHWWAALH